MRQSDKQRQFIVMRAAGKSYRQITEELGIPKTTAQRWDAQFAEDITELQKEELRELQSLYSIGKGARIKRLGEKVKAIDAALDTADLDKVPPGKLLEMWLRYNLALKDECAPLDARTVKADADSIVASAADLANRARAGLASMEQIQRESAALMTLIKAVELSTINTRIEELERIVYNELEKEA